MLHIGGQIDIIHQQLDKICSKDGEYGLPSAVARSLIVKHHKIIDFSDSIESLFSQIALMQFLSSIVIMCCIGFLVISVSMLDHHSITLETSFCKCWVPANISIALVTMLHIKVMVCTFKHYVWRVRACPYTHSKPASFHAPGRKQIII